MDTQNQESPEYKIPGELLQGIVHVLNSLPAGQVRGLLNAIEQIASAQDSERAATKRTLEIEAALTEASKGKKAP